MKHIEVVAAILVKGDAIFATRRGYGEFKGFWEFPGGKVEKNEDKENALKREIREELGAEIRIKRHFLTSEHAYPAFTVTLHFYLCELTKDRITLIEHEDGKWIGQTELNDLRWLEGEAEVISKLRESWIDR